MTVKISMDPENMAIEYQKKASMGKLEDSEGSLEGSEHGMVIISRIHIQTLPGTLQSLPISRWKPFLGYSIGIFSGSIEILTVTCAKKV